MPVIDRANSRPASLWSRLGIPLKRVPEERGDVRLPAGTIVVSADNHWSLADDVFYDRFPEHLKNRAPRIKWHEEGFYRWEMDGKPLLPRPAELAVSAFEAVPGTSNLDERMKYLTQEGMDKEIIFPNTLQLFFSHPDDEVREWVFRIHNQCVAEFQEKSKGRTYGVAFINYWDMDKTRDSVLEAKALGLKTLMLPSYPKRGGVPINYCLPEMEPLWSALEEADLPICFHVGEFYIDGPGGIGISSMMNLGPFRKTLGELIFGGILERHPSLRVVFVEADLNWVPGALQTADMTYETYNEDLLEPKLPHPPRHYWEKNCYVTFMNDPAGFRLLDLIGVDQIMWTSDFPHVESTYGVNWSSIKAVVDLLSANEARKVLGGTAIELFRLND